MSGSGLASRIRGQLLLETPLVIGIAQRDLLRRVLGGLLVSLVIASSGAFLPAVQLFGILAGFELLGFLAFPRYRAQSAEKSTSAPLSIWVLTLTSLAVICYPAILFVQMQTTPLLLAGFIWIFGLMVHVTNTYASLPFYKWTMVAVLIASAAGITLLASHSDYRWSGGYQLTIALMMLVAYFGNTFDTLRKQKETYRALDTARQEAGARLSQLEHLNRHDPLTGLKNRGAFDEDVDMMQRDAPPDAPPLTVLLLDLDGFKPINDSYTHAAGDEILRMTARRLQAFFTEVDVVARLGGDEFAVATRIPRTEAAARDCAERIVKSVSQPIDFGQRQLSVGCSIGVARAAYQSDTAAQLLNQADQAMYRAKDDNANPVKVFDSESYPQRATLDDRVVLIEAMNNHEIIPHYQPKIDLRSKRMLGMEALARWQHPEQGLIMPGKFLPLINELSLQGHFLDHSLKRTLADIEQMLAAGLNPGQVSVNLPEVPLATISGRDSLKSLMSQHPGALPFLTFEVTEDIFIARSNSIIQDSIMQFRRMGVRISLDDFGTGFASFQHLRELEFDELKLDTGFVRGLGQESEAEVLVRAFLNIGHGLDVDVIAEGVETEQQCAMLTEMGCISAQGFLFSKAIPFKAIMARLKKEQFVPRTAELGAARAS